MRRNAREVHGWFPVGVPISAIGQMFDGIKVMARKAWRDPGSLELLVRGNAECRMCHAGRIGAISWGRWNRLPPTSPPRELGAAEPILDVQFSPDVGTLDPMLARMAQLRNVAH